MKKIMFNNDFCLTQAVLAGQKTMMRRIEKPTEMKIGRFFAQLPLPKD